ncbi:hypothetical protein UFOVP1344_37 [uncultured Caudovirales phage]|uniref:Uncharacterized protein n=1 Tax=uncultured Caudovirales phage TaxID=2100421 RepID=A0A6J5SSJ3_9CAUD|nr:hypothetical protein UFOVP1005_37 [uncultured Caudovirales phage]CAB4200270.1 hypothetical protein UFOVP1344_37 [uncultured Caudovirales phage]CAB4218066.1 hypothetical protein UFOVP1602_3 [uncultured Caudovirales phage]
MPRLVERQPLGAVGTGAATPSAAPSAPNPIRPVTPDAPISTPVAPTWENAGPSNPTTGPTTPKPVEPPAMPKAGGWASPLLNPAIRGFGSKPVQNFIKRPAVQGLLNSAQAQGHWNPFKPLQGPVTKNIGAKANYGAFIIGNVAANALGQKEMAVQIYKDMGYPTDAAQAAGDAYGLGGSLATTTASLVDYAVQDLEMIAGGAAIGFVFGGPAGAGVGAAAGMTVAGLSNLGMMVEGLINMGIMGSLWAMGKDYTAPASGKWIDIPTADDFMPRASTWIDAITGEPGSYYQNAMDFGASAAADAAIGAKYPGRFKGWGDVLKENQRIVDNYYATSSEVDPRAAEVASLVEKGYFIKQTPNGLGINYDEYQKYLLETSMYNLQSDRETHLPAISPAGQERAARGTLTENEWYTLFSNGQ